MRERGPLDGVVPLGLEGEERVVVGDDIDGRGP